MQLALIIPISPPEGWQPPTLPGLPTLPGQPTHPIAPGGPGAGQLPTFPNAPSRDELKAAIKAKLEELIAGFNPPSRDEIRQKLDQIADALRDRIAGALPPGCIAQPK